MDLIKSPHSLYVDSPDPHSFACVMLYSGASGHLVTSTSVHRTIHTGIKCEQGEATSSD